MKYILIMFLLCYGINMTAQSHINNVPLSIQHKLNNDIVDFPLPALNNEELVQETMLFSDFKAIAKDIPTGISLENAKIEEVGDYLIWRIKISSKTAHGLVLFFTNFELPKDGTLYYYDTEKKNIYGGYNYMNNNRTKTFTSENLMFDGEVIIEYNCLKKKFKELPFKLKSIGHIFLSRAQFGDALPCHNDVNCQPHIDNWCYQIRSVVKIFMRVEDINSGVIFFGSMCSGVLVNSINTDFDPLILTAQHCVDPEARFGDNDEFRPIEYDLWRLFFNFQSPECTNPTEVGNDRLITTGVDFLISSGGGTETVCPDIALLRIVDLVNTLHPIPIQYNVFYAGVNSIDLGNNVEVATIHHPAGDVKKISIGERQQHLQYRNRKCWKVEYDTDGIIEGGSSGGPLFGSDRRVIGINHAVSLIDDDGTNDDPRYCTEGQIAWHGKVQDFWSELAPFLLDNDEDIVAYDGIDPIAACQEHIEILGNIFPALDWQPKNDLTIQAANTIEVAPNAVNTQFLTSPAFMTNNHFADYTFKAGSSVKINPGFSIGRGHTLKVKIGNCEVFTECGFNYPSKIAPPISDELEAQDEVNKSSIKVNETNENYLTRIYPNPTTNEITIESSKSYHLNIFNMMGQQVGQENDKAKTVQYDMTKFEAGIYIFQFRFEDGTMETIRVIKQ